MRDPGTWTKDDLDIVDTPFPEPDYSSFRNKFPVEIFELFFDEDIVSFLCSESTRYALFKNETNPQIKPEEMKVFLRILLSVAMFRFQEREDIGKTLLTFEIRWCVMPCAVTDSFKL